MPPSTLQSLSRSTLLFPFWALACSALAYAFPTPFAAAKPAIVPLLVVIMFGMGMSLTAADFWRVLRRPRVILLGTLLQYAVMPLAAFLVARLFQLPPELLVGMVLVGASSGGTASNVIAYLARGDVALSITLTLCSTLLAVFALPGLTWLYAGQMVEVQAQAMLLTVLKIVVAPVALGALLNTLLGARLRALRPLFPLLSMAAIVFIIGIIVGLNQPRLGSVGAGLLLAIILHNGIGLFAGYGLPRLAGYDAKTCRTLAIEVGMQNSGLSVALAIKYFSAATALPGALFSIWHNLSGSVLAAYWGRNRNHD